MRAAIALAAAALFTFVTHGSAQVQPQPGARPLLRLDAFTTDPAALHLAAGAGVRAGTYARAEVVGGLGVAEGGSTSARADVLVRFLLDPFRERPIGWYLGGGVGARHDEAPGWRGVVLAAAGAEGRPRGGWAPFAEVGIGGGLRLGVGVRRSTDPRFR